MYNIKSSLKLFLSSFGLHKILRALGQAAMRNDGNTAQQLLQMDLTASESKATYEKIKAWVLEQTGINVSYLYTAQVKRKYGIIERENYNKPKSEESTQPQCPPDKEKAITDAFKRFGMLPMEDVYDNRDL